MAAWSDGGAQTHTSPPQRRTRPTPQRTPPRRTSRWSRPGAWLGGREEITVTTRNNGVVAAGQVTVIDTLPTKMSFSAAGSSQGCVATATRQVNCALGTLSGGQEVTTTIILTNGNAKGQVRNEVRGHLDDARLEYREQHLIASAKLRC